MIHKTGLKIKHHNILGVRSKIVELIEHMNSETPDIISPNETFLKPKMKTPVIPGYAWTKNDRKTGKGRKVAFIKDFVFDISENIVVKMETAQKVLTIELYSSKNASFHISTVYCLERPSFLAFFVKLCKNKPKHICGDFNAKHTILGDASDSQLGRQFFQIVSETDLLFTNNKIPTFFGKNTLKGSILDPILIMCTLTNYFNGFHVDKEDLGSDHNIIIAWFGLKTLCTEKASKTIKLWEETNEQLLTKFSKLDFSTTTDPLYKIEEQANSLVHFIQKQ